MKHVSRQTCLMAHKTEGAEWERSVLMCLLNETLSGIKALNLQY